MRNILVLCAALLGVAIGTTSCSTSLTLSTFSTWGGSTAAASYVDDLYGVHDRAALREAERLAAEQLAKEKAEQEKRIAAMVAAANAGADIDEILDLSDEGIAANIVTLPSDGGTNVTYANIYVDDYESAYARRLQGFTSLTYRMPASYWNFRYSDAYFLSLAYDPAFYTVMVMGDQVWVEPRYITNMFGSWNNPYYYGYRYGYNPYYYGYSYGYWDYWGWNSPYWACDPFFYNPYYHPYYYGWYSPHYHHHHTPHHPAHRPGGPGGPGGLKRPNVAHKPSYGGGAVGGGSSMRPGGGTLSYNDRLGGRGGTQIATGTKTTTTSSSSVRPSVRPGSGNIQSGTTTDRGSSLNKPTTKGELSSTLSGTTINSTAPRTMRDSGTRGVSNSSSRSTRSSGTTTQSSSSSSSSQKKSSGSVSSSSSSRSSSSSSRSSSSYSSSSSSRSSYSSGSSSSRSGGSYSSGSSSRSSSSRGGR